MNLMVIDNFINYFTSCDIERLAMKEVAADYIEEDHVDGREAEDDGQDIKQFPNGFQSWMETHHDIVEAITMIMAHDQPTGTANDRHEAEGHGGLYELGLELTDKFENKYCGIEWGTDIEYMDTMDEFIKEELHN